MNKKRMSKLITALKTEAAKNMFHMGHWAKRPPGARTPKQAFRVKGNCGTSACIAGMAAIVDPKYFRMIRIDKDFYYIINKNGSKDETAFAEWLKIPTAEADTITYPGSGIWDNYAHTNIAHAINVLEAYRDGGMDLVGKIEGVELA